MEPKLAHLDFMVLTSRQSLVGTANQGNAPASHDINASDSGSPSAHYSSFNKGCQARMS